MDFAVKRAECVGVRNAGNVGRTTQHVVDDVGKGQCTKAVGRQWSGVMLQTRGATVDDQARW